MPENRGTKRRNPERQELERQELERQELERRNLSRLRRRRERSAGRFSRASFLVDHAAREWSDRLAEMGAFGTGLNLGRCGGSAASALRAGFAVDVLVHLDAAAGMASGAVSGAASEAMTAEASSSGVAGSGVAGLGVAGLYDRLPFRSRSFDAVVSLLSLHGFGPGTAMATATATEALRVLKPGGVFAASLYGSGSLRRLREAFLHADAKIGGGAARRVAPLPDVMSCGDWLRRAGFEEAVSDREEVTVGYRDLSSLVQDLRDMGESGMGAETIAAPRPVWREATLRWERNRDADGRVPESVELIHVKGRRPP